MATDARDWTVCRQAILDAGREIMKRYATFERIEDAPADISTDADRASQEIILQQLHGAFPNDRLCGEESTQTLADAARAGGPRLWIVDPIDGTRGFAKKNGEFSVMIGLVVEGEVVLGAVFEPAIDRLTFAAKGKGCFVETQGADPRQVRVTGTADLAGSIMSISRSQKAAGRQRLLDAFGAKDTVETYSAGIKLAQVARGETDLYLGDYLTLKDWDVAAGHILVTEAGGRVTNVDGAPIRYEGTGKSLAGRGILATNAKVHDACLAVLQDGKYQFA